MQGYLSYHVITHSTQDYVDSPQDTRAKHLQLKITSANCCLRLINPPIYTTKLLESKGHDLDNTRNHSINCGLLGKYTTRKLLMPKNLIMLPPSASTNRSIKTPIWRPDTQKTSLKTRRFAGYSLTLLPPNSLNQKTVVLDLDQTLVHSTLFYLPADIPPCRSYDFRFMLGEREVFCVKKRPFVDKFLEYLNLKNFEIVIFTAGEKGYASSLLDKLDPNGLISHRLYRDSCKVFNRNYIKDLSRLGRDLSNVVIVDDRPSSYKLQPENGIHIKPFYDDLQDDELKKLALNFFNTCNDYNDLKDAVKHYQDRLFYEGDDLGLKFLYMEER